MPAPELRTVGELLHWSYANIAMAHAALSKGATKYGREHWAIRARLYAGLRNGTMQTGSFADDERIKMILPQACCYCGNAEQLSIDHLIPRARGGPDTGDNFVWACRACNSSKGMRDAMDWLAERRQQCPLLLVRRFLKLALVIARTRDVMDRRLDETLDLPFSVAAVPTWFPLDDAKLWITPLPR
jgi:hypothetical protein